MRNKFIAVEISWLDNEHTGVKLYAGTEQDIIDKINFFNEEKVYWMISDTEENKQYRLMEDMTLEQI